MASDLYVKHRPSVPDSTKAKQYPVKWPVLQYWIHKQQIKRHYKKKNRLDACEMVIKGKKSWHLDTF